MEFSSKQAWTILLLVHVGSKWLDLIGVFTNWDTKYLEQEPIQRKLHYNSAGQTSLLQVQCEFTLDWFYLSSSPWRRPTRRSKYWCSLSTCLVFICVLYIASWRTHLHVLDACEILYITADSTVTAFWASSVQCIISWKKIKPKKPPQMSHTWGTSKPCQSAQTSEPVSMRNCSGNCSGNDSSQ